MMCKQFLPLPMLLAVVLVSSLQAHVNPGDEDKTRSTTCVERKRRMADTAKAANVNPCGRNPLPFRPVNYTARSCLDHMLNGATRCGHYVINDGIESYSVFCDINSEIGAAYTLVESFALKYNKKGFQRKSLTQNFPVNHNSPRWDYYRLTKERMARLAGVSTHWRAACNFPKVGINHKDYLRVKMSELNPVTFSGTGTCKRVELIELRGRLEFDLTVTFWQKENTFHLCHTSNNNVCQMGKTAGTNGDEDDWGYYNTVNPRFSCVASPESTTQYWFGGYV
eukprot:m.2243 g.2243  ORF g.2243 m.2243 type:complete len:281 (+) comp8485_c0_seq1:238-1080(+)